MSFNVVLFQPEIPQNTGNIGRICVGFKSKLHLIEPLGFKLEDRYLKRAGLDYWPHLDFRTHSSWEHWIESLPEEKRIFIFSTKGSSPFYDQKYQEGDWLVFGRETKGLTPEIYEKYKDKLVTIPFPGPVRSFNLSNSVAMALSEAYRQINH